MWCLWWVCAVRMFSEFVYFACITNPSCLNMPAQHECSSCLHLPSVHNNAARAAYSLVCRNETHSQNARLKREGCSELLGSKVVKGCKRLVKVRTGWWAACSSWLADSVGQKASQTFVQPAPQPLY